MENSQNYSLLITKLDQFIRKYYVNQLIRGSLYSIGLILALFIVFNAMEYFLYFDTGTRKLLFYSFLIASIAAIGIWVVVPMIKYFHLGKTISHEQAASIIGDHFTDVKDKLLNVLQLKKLEATNDNQALITASIDQKTEAIKLVPFKSAIDLSKNKKYLKYALPPFLALILILFSAPSIIKDGAYRIINNDKKFEKAAPFHFSLNKEDLNVIQFNDFKLDVDVTGSILPNEVFVEIDNFLYKMDKNSNSSFSYTFRNVQKDTKFKIVSGPVIGEEFLLNVLEKPNLADFTISMVYPSYIGRSNEMLSNIGDVIVPEGTRMEWKFNTSNTDVVALKFGNEAIVNAESWDANKFKFKKSIRVDQPYAVYISNKIIPQPDSITYSINVVKDQVPVINVEEFKDSLDANLLYFVGSASDDYGLSSLSFNYTITKQDGKQLPLQTIKMKKENGREIQYDKTFDVRELNLAPGDNVSYYFEVYDNDGVNGAKSAKTGVMTFAKPTLEQFKEMEQKNEDEIKDKLKETKENIDKLQDQFKKMREKLLQQKKLDWQDKKELEKLVEEQKKLQEQLEKAKEKFDENMKNQEEFQKPDEQTQEKQENLQKMFEEAMDPEQKELMDKIQQLMQELEKDDALQMMEQMEQKNENKAKETERLLELYKQLEVEKDVKDLTDKLEELAEKEDKLAKDTEQDKKSKEEIKKEQEDLKKEMDEAKKDLKELEEKNEDLKHPKELGDDNEEKMDEIKEDMEDSQQSMDKGDKKSASKSQKGASKKMKSMADKMISAMESGDQEQQAEDLKLIRQLLENLVTVSFDQEQLAADFGTVSTTTPKYVSLIQTQYKLKDEFQIIEDSLTALSQRNDKVASFVNEKVTEVKYNLNESLKLLEDRQAPKANESQRRTMTNLNDLALMLSESMENMQQQMSGSMPGSQMCNKPGGKGSGKSGKVPMDKITDGQQGVGEELGKLKDKMGKSGKEGASAKDFAEAAAKQAAMRKALEDARKERQEQGKGADGGLQEIIDQMDKIETELVNKRLNAETLKRQQDIMTRLLEAEKAERQRELDNKRKSESGKDIARELPPSLQEYLKKRQAEIEMYKTISPSLRPHYKYLVDEYYKSLKNGK